MSSDRPRSYTELEMHALGFFDVDLSRLRDDVPDGFDVDLVGEDDVTDGE